MTAALPRIADDTDKWIEPSADHYCFR